MAKETRVALITGGARRLGAACARELHRRGLNLVIHCRNSMDDALTLKAELEAERRDSVRILQADLDDCEAVRALAQQALDQWQRIDVLVNNGPALAAGCTIVVKPATATPYSALALAEHQGAIVNLVDVYADKPLAGHALYSVAKAGLAQLTRAAARELGPAVRVNGVSPGPILWPEQGQDNQSDILHGTALKHSGDPSDIAGAVAFLALDAPFITGQILAVDGGRSLSFHGG